MKKFNLFKMLAVLIVLITSINTAWAGGSLNNGYIKASFNGSACWSGNWYDLHSSSSNKSPETGVSMGILSGDFIITDIKMKFSVDYRVWASHHTMWCNIDGDDESFHDWTINWETYGEKDKTTTGEPVANSIDITVARHTDPSGTHSLNVGFYSRFEWSYGNFEPTQDLKTFYFNYTVLPPDVSDFTVAASGTDILYGSGTESDPYVIAYDGSFTLTSSDAVQEHGDPNSSEEFSLDNSTWGTSSSYTTKTIDNVQAYTNQSVNLYARFTNSSLHGGVKTKTIYYKAAPWTVAGGMNSWNTNANPLIHTSGTTYSTSVNLDANTDVAFKIVDNANSKWYTYSSSTSDVNLTYTANSGKSYSYNSDGSYGNTIIKTAGAGDYTFTWDSEGESLTVTYPTSYTVTFGYGTHGTSVTATGSVSGELAASGKYVAKGENVTFEETHDTGYKLNGWYTASSGGSVVGTMSSSDNVLNSIAANANVYAQYVGNDFTVRFNANYPSGAVNNGASMDDQAFVYATAQNISANAFACEGYTFTGWKKDNATSGDDVTAGSDGSTLTTTDGATVDLYAQWSDDGTYYYKGASASGWATASNWTRNAVPGSTDDVIVLTALNAPSGTTTVNSVRIATSGTYTPVGGSGITADGSLTIPSGAALKVVTNVANCTISANAPTSGTSTTSSTLNIGYGGALVWRTAGTPGDATVGFYTPSGGVAGSQDAVNDYIGIPFTSLSSDAYSNAWVFAVSGDTWAEISGADMSPWTGYNIIEKKEKSGEFGGSYSLTGTLVANNATVSGGATAGTETLYANSWVAPIKIDEIDFSGTATVYLFNPASFNQIVSAGEPLGNYTAKPKNQGGYIPSMKSFSVVSTTVSINYASAVYGEVSGAYSAPRRARKVDYRQAIWDTQDSLFIYVKSASGWGDELKMFIHEDFSQNYENGWDGPKMEGMWEAPKLYTLNNEGEMAVSCVPSADNSVIAFHAGTASNEYTFTFKYSGEDELVLKDTKTGVETPIEDGGTYEFTSNTSDDDLRFVIKKVSNAATGVDEIGGNASGVQKIMHNGTMYILREGRIYSAEGAFVK